MKLSSTDILKKQEPLEEELNIKISKIAQKVKKDFQIPSTVFGKNETEKKGILIELEDLRNWSMQSNLKIKSI